MRFAMFAAALNWTCRDMGGCAPDSPRPCSSLSSLLADLADPGAGRPVESILGLSAFSGGGGHELKWNHSLLRNTASCSARWVTQRDVEAVARRTQDNPRASLDHATNLGSAAVLTLPVPYPLWQDQVVRQCMAPGGRGSSRRPTDPFSCRRQDGLVGSDLLVMAPDGGADGAKEQSSVRCPHPQSGDLA
ncbi:hypothetical protein GCM10009744_33100 [Kribbella alba]|uniref:Uncharacterized protein n=1 Tax=Kribbella alba TaxID=190197 RepID=A0ABN2FCK6_9ACTN